MVNERSVKTKVKDEDPNKFVVILDLLKKHRDILPIWREFGIMERKVDAVYRKHRAPEHLIAGALYGQALGQLLAEKDHLSEKDVTDIEEAYLLHDCGKPLEAAIIKAAVSDDSSWSKIEESVASIYLPDKEYLLKSIKERTETFMTSEVEKGVRIHVARSVIAGEIHKERLKSKGIASEIIQMQSTTEYSSCPDVEGLLENYVSFPESEKRLALKRLVVHWLDDSMTESVMKPIENRTKDVFRKENNILLSTAYKYFNNGNESAEEIQIRVGKRVENFLANLIGVQDNEVQNTVEKKLQHILSQYI